MKKHPVCISVLLSILLLPAMQFSLNGDITRVDRCRHDGVAPAALTARPKPKITNAGETRVTVLFFNDLHGQLLPYKVRGSDGQSVEVGGIAGLSALAKGIRKENSARGRFTLLLVAGDVLQGTPMSTVFRGRADMEVLNAMGVDAMVMGNHELDFGVENFLELRKIARFPIISANVAWKDTGALVNPPSRTFTLGTSLRLTVIGITTEELLTTTAPSNVVNIAVLDAKKSIAPVLRESLQRGPVILLSHSRHKADTAVVCALPGIAAVIGGHDQVLLDPPKISCGVPLMQAHEKGRFLGRIDLAVDRKTGRARIEKHSYIPVTPALTQDAVVARIVASYNSKLDKTFSQVIGQSLVFMEGGRGRIRYEETNLGNFVADVMREYTSADLALLNAGSLRGSIENGPVTIDTVFRVMPYANELMTVTLSGGEIMEALDRAVRGTREDEDGGFLHVSGIAFTIRNKKAVEIRLTPGGAPLEHSKHYTVALTDFMYSGGDGYRVFTDKPAVKTGLPLRELLVETIRKRGSVDSKSDGRIRRLD